MRGVFLLVVVLMCAFFVSVLSGSLPLDGDVPHEEQVEAIKARSKDITSALLSAIDRKMVESGDHAQCHAYGLLVTRALLEEITRVATEAATYEMCCNKLHDISQSSVRHLRFCGERWIITEKVAVEMYGKESAKLLFARVAAETVSAPRHVERDL